VPEPAKLASPILALAPPYVCAALNGVAAIALATVLRPGLGMDGDASAAAAYVAGHVVEWRAGWLLWMAAGLSLVVFYVWWARRLKGTLVRVALAISILGLVADLGSEAALVLWLPERYAEVAAPALVVSGVAANGFYSLAGALLTLATPGLPALLRVWAWGIWSCGGLLTASVILSLPLLAAVATAALFALLCPWCVLVARRLG